MVDLVGSPVAEAAAGAMIEFGRDVVALSLGESAEMSSPGQILAEEPVGVLVGPALPGVVRGDEVDAGAELALDLLVAMELGPVVGSEGVDPMWFVREQCDGAGVGVLDGGARQRADADEAAFAFDRGDDARLAAAVDGVEFPITEAAATVHEWRAPIGAAISHGPSPLDATFSLEESRLCAAARGSPLTFGKK
jgi:hypothetical protein